MQKTSTKMYMVISLSAALTFITYYFRIPIGPVPFTLQTAIVILTGLLLTPLPAFLTQTINLVLMILFNNALVSPTLGYLIGFALAAPAIALISRKHTRALTSALAIVTGELLIHLVGFSYLSFIMIHNAQGQPVDLVNLAATAILPFIIPDIVKAIIAYMIAKRLHRFRMPQ